ncbi:NAD-dependent epimerase/dehydratase family protein [Actinomadura namibiensis]|uniref:Nucleoside-diphosphate-sugar epimerase n=1 Tax=Actinomadura namibiensis TaxID=182080 RepID=A0A7W3QQV5_ACTNM|nr:NAD-dependent epimerase/dehydratase family protein [Actinomadura namibiensis]MBA8956084.1 nucleoside-diphosphate-sugar epimerase [Actinomadura namibiensis]
MMKVFVTGATGFLGGRVVDGLLAEGHRVRALVRDPSRAPRGVEVTRGGLADVAAWEADLAGCDVVVHLAAVVSTWERGDGLSRVNVGGTRDLIEAAKRHGVRRFVHMSSESVLQEGRPLLDIDEGHPAADRPSSRYGAAKLLAERAVRAHAGGIETITLRPAFIWGPGSAHVAGFVARARAGRLPLVDKGRAVVEHVHVDNVAAATVAALTEGAPGGTYFITNGEPMPVRDLLGGILGAFDTALPTRSLPGRLAYAAAGAGERLWRTLPLPGRPPVTRFEVEFLALPRRYDITRARTELGYVPAVTFADGLKTLGTAR